MKFLEIINKKKFLLISIFLLLYVILNLLPGERGLISFHDKQKNIKELSQKKITLINNLSKIENENNLLTEIVDLDYLETLYRQKFMLGKLNEKIYKIKN